MKSYNKTEMGSNKEPRQTKLTQMALKFQKGLIDRRKFLNSISKIILSIPTKFNVIDEDTMHEFYAYILSKIETIISRYKTRKYASFYTWFTFVLVRQFLNFQTKKKAEVNFSEEKNLQQYYQDVEMKINGDKTHEEFAYLSETPNEIRDKSSVDLSFLSQMEKMVIAYKYGLDIDKHNILPTMARISEKVEIKRKLESYVGLKYYKILKLQERLQVERDEKEILRIKEKEKKMRKTKKQMENRISKYKIYPSNAWVGKKLGLSQTTVASYLIRIKRKFTNRLDKDLH